ncbi:metalloregulator ArsR/SmtB family transcription factor [Granulicella sp. 5B5]|uniref:ArsR/SmtB family transcription factor n=1 Tax=Granulicella sp. 5B5 TaxID=1617967 RepID=UPI0015F61F25|nr:metalloregulator ArsR/SmtB family transcription factor [Granulicella sp. 5B5]QMV18460.1 metalloregulator ArsR/SmtB family transcription factor [Granulicella sp. 5B5]
MTDPISTTFAALADPTRRAILARLALGETSVTELAEPFEMSLPAVSKHLRVLEHAGLISRGREAQWRPCKLEAEPLRQASDWLEFYRRFWEQSFDRLEEYLQRVQAEQPSKTRKIATRKPATRNGSIGKQAKSTHSNQREN